MSTAEPDDLLSIRPELLEAFNVELRYLHEGVREFVTRWPTAATSLNVRDDGQSTDPIVERLIEAVAFQTARIQLRLTEERARVPQALLELVYPEIVTPFPSCSIVKFVCDPNRPLTGKGHVVGRGTELKAREDVLGTFCRFRTAYDVQLWPFEIVAASLDDEKRLSVRFRNASRTPLSAFDVGRLRLHLKGQGLAGTIYELLIGGVEEVAIRIGGQMVALPDATVRPVGFRHPDEALVDPSPRTSPGLMTLLEYLHFPEKFAFVDVEGLSGVFARAGDEEPFAEWDLLFRLRTVDRLERIDASNFDVGCTPIVNVFEGSIEPRKLTGRELDVPVVAAAPSAFRVDLENLRAPYHSEVYRIDRVTVSRPGTGVSHYEPFLQFREGGGRAGISGFWQAERRPTSMRGAAARRARSGPASERDPDGTTIPGTDVVLSITDLGDTPFTADRYLSVTGLFTNRHLARALKSAVALDFAHPGPAGDMVLSIRLVADVTETRPPRLDDDAMWRLVSLLSLNYLPLDDATAGANASRDATPLRTLLELHNFGDSPSMTQRIDAIASVRTRQHTRRVWWPEGAASVEGARWVGIDAPPPHALVGLVRGTEVTVVLHERQPTGEIADSPIVFGAVLDRYFRSLAGVNGFTETVVRLRRSDGTERELRRWPPAFGDVPAL